MPLDGVVHDGRPRRRGPGRSPSRPSPRARQECGSATQDLIGEGDRGSGPGVELPLERNLDDVDQDHLTGFLALRGRLTVRSWTVRRSASSSASPPASGTRMRRSRRERRFRRARRIMRTDILAARQRVAARHQVEALSDRGSAVRRASAAGAARASGAASARCRRARAGTLPSHRRGRARSRTRAGSRHAADPRSRVDEPLAGQAHRFVLGADRVHLPSVAA